MTATKDEFFKPGKLSAQAKAAQTDAAARDILAAEANARQKKPEKLKALRLAQPVLEEGPKKARRKSAAT